jgi:hypothetical protein
MSGFDPRQAPKTRPMSQKRTALVASLGGHGFSRAIMQAILLVPTSREATSAVRFCAIGRVFGV